MDEHLEVRHVKKDVNIDLSDPEKTEIALITLGHELSLSTDRSEKALGIMMKGLAPGFSWALKETFFKDGNPKVDHIQDFIMALANTAAVLTAMSVTTMIKPHGYGEVVEDVNKMFNECLSRNVGSKDWKMEKPND